MKIIIAAIGKIKNKDLSKVADLYSDRIKHYYNFEILELKNIADFQKNIKTGDFIIACDERGKEFKSREFASWVEKLIPKYKRLVFLIGEADGLDQFTKQTANEILSFSKFTLQHDLARVILLEQIYRASTIIKGEPYHRD